jgi:uncharacterized membrane protein YoaK (UPF0700 family)
MIRYERKFRLLAMCFAGLAGFVDAIGFLKSGGLFVSFMTGNSTRLAIGAVEFAPLALAAAGLIILFVFGVAVSVVVSSRAGSRKTTAAAVLASLLVGAAIAETMNFDVAVIGILCLAMGASNTIFQRDGEVTIGVTYMTGTLVKLGQRLAGAFLGGDRKAWLPYLILWASLVLGGVVGAFAYLHAPVASLWAAALAAMALVHFVRRVTSHP